MGVAPQYQLMRDQVYDEGSEKINADIINQIRNNREDVELSSFQQIENIGFRQKDEEFKGSNINSLAAAPQSVPQQRGNLRLFPSDITTQIQSSQLKTVEINTQNNSIFKVHLSDEPFVEPTREERFKQNVVIYNSRKQNLMQVISQQSDAQLAQFTTSAQGQGSQPQLSQNLPISRVDFHNQSHSDEELENRQV